MGQNGAKVGCLKKFEFAVQTRYHGPEMILNRAMEGAGVNIFEA